MGRLIDADALLDRISLNYNNHQNITAGAMKDMINTTPTAYDVEKVVAELEKLKQHNKELSEGAYLEDDKSFYFCAYTNFARAIGIVRKGGVEWKSKS